MNEISGYTKSKICAGLYNHTGETDSWRPVTAKGCFGLCCIYMDNYSTL